MPDLKYPGSTPVDEPIAPRKGMKKPMGKSMMKPKARPMYPSSVPVDEPVAPPTPAPAAPMTAMKKGGSVGSASRRADGIAQRGKTKGTMVMCGGGMARGK
jgi:hypothetical protein